MSTIAVLLKLFSPLTKLYGVVIKKTGKRYGGYRALKAAGIKVSATDFDMLYNVSLEEYENRTAKHTLVVGLFREPSARVAFRNDYYRKTENQLLDDLNTNLQVLDKYSDLRAANINLKREVDEFVNCFAKRVNAASTPVEKMLSNKMDDISAQLAKMSGSAMLPAEEAIDLSDYISELDSLRNDNQHLAAIAALKRFKEKRWRSLSKELKYKVNLNFAITYFEMGEKKEGARYFLDLLELEIKPAETYGFAALGYALLHDNENAIINANRGLELDAGNENAYLALLFAKEDTLEPADIDQLIPTEIQKKPSIAINIGTQKESKGDYEGAFDIFQALEKNYTKRDFFKADILTVLAVNRIKSTEHMDEFFLGDITDEEKTKLEYAIAKFTEAWDIIKDTSLRASRWYILANRGVAYKAFGKKDKAEEDFRISLELKPNFFTFRHLLQLYFNDKEKFDQLLEQAGNLPLQQHEEDELLLFKLHQAFSNNTTGALLPQLVAALPKVTDEVIKAMYFTNIVHAFLSLGNTTEAEAYARKFIEARPDDPAAYNLLSQVHLAKNEPGEAMAMLNQAKALVTSTTPRPTAFMIADAFVSSRDFESIVEILEKVVDKTMLSQYNKNLILAYYKLGHYSKAETIVVPLLIKYPGDEFLTDLASSIYEASGDFDAAIALLNKFLSGKPGDKYMLVKLAMNYYKKSDYTNGNLILNKIKEYSDIPIEVQFAIADAYIKGGNTRKGLDIAYQLRQENYHDPIAHTKYVQLQSFADEAKQGEFYPLVVTMDCNVVIRTADGKQQEYILLDNPKGPKEISPGEELGRKLLGKSVGDSIEAGNGAMFTITAIISKYTQAYLDSLEQINLRFNNQGDVKVLSFPPGDTPEERLAPLLRSMDDQIQRDKEIAQFYKSGKATFGACAAVSHLSAIHYLSKLSGDPSTGIYSVWTKFELQMGGTLLDSNKGVILDITALMALYHLKALPLLDLLPNKKYITLSTLEEIKNELAKILQHADREHISVGKIEGQYVRHVITVEEKQKQIEKLQEFIRLAEQHTEVITPSVTDDFARKLYLDKLLGKSFNESRQVAVERDLLLFSDDAMFRALCYNEYRLSGISTIIFIGDLTRRQLATQDELMGYYTQLIRFNYRYVPVNEKILLTLCKEAGFQVGPPFANACDVLDIMYLRDLEAVKLTGLFLYELYKEASITTTRQFIAQFVLGKLFKGRNSDAVKRLLVPFLDTKFRLLQLQLSELISWVSDF